MQYVNSMHVHKCYVCMHVLFCVIVVTHHCGYDYCLNNGICVNGEHKTCICQPGFTGHFCEHEICKPVLSQRTHTYSTHCTYIESSW